MKIDETGRIYTDLYIGEIGDKLPNIFHTSIGRKILVPGNLYYQYATETIVLTISMGNFIIDKLMLEPITLVITKPTQIFPAIKLESISVVPTAIKELLRTLAAESATVTPTGFPSLTKFLTETITNTISLIKRPTHKLVESVVITPTIFKLYISIKTLTQAAYVTPTAYKQTTHRLAESIAVTVDKFIGRYKELTQSITIACAMGGRNITHRLAESADMIAESAKVLVRVVEDEIVHVLPTAYKQPLKRLYEPVSVAANATKQTIKNLASELITITDTFYTGFLQRCNEAIGIACTMDGRTIVKTLVEIPTIVHTKAVNITKYIYQNVLMNVFVVGTQNIFVYLTETIVITLLINKLRPMMFTAKQTVNNIRNKQTLADIKEATLTKVSVAGTQLDSMKKATITAVKKRTGIFKQGDEQR